MSRKRSATAATSLDSDDDDPTNKRPRLAAGDVQNLEDVDALRQGIEREEQQYNERRANERRLGARAAAGGSRKENEHFAVIKELVIHDFMCHHHLVFKFGPQINFVIGHNGSGKSAIQTAITIALGGKTTATGRASGMKDLIRTGADQAKIILTLHNGTHEAFKPEQYGDEITIERTINRDTGGSTWRMRGKKHGNKIIATKKEELTQMCLSMGIQIDNTLTTLSQDQSRAFLSTTDESKMYSLFLQGTGLAALVQSYQGLETNITMIESNIGDVRSRLPDLLREQNKWREIHETLETARRAKEEIIELKKHQCWAHVRDKEIQRDGALKTLDQVTEKVANDKILVKEAEHEIKNADEQVTAAERDAAQYQDKFQELEDQRGAIEAEITSTRHELQTAQANQAELLASIKTRDAEIATFTEKRNAELAKHGNAELDQQRAKLQEDKAKTEDLLRKIQRERDINVGKRRDKCKERDDIDQEIAKVNTSRNEVQGQIATLDKSLDILRRQADGTDMLAMYGHNIQAVKQEIAQSHWRKGPPLGPLGTFVKLKPGENEYAKAINQLLFAHFHSWAVMDFEDKQQLMRIFYKCINSRGTNFEGSRSAGSGNKTIPPIITHTGELFNYASGDWRQYHATVLSKLEFTDPRVERIFINASHIEKLFMSKTRYEADPLVQRLQVPGLPHSISADGFRVSKTNQSGGANSTVLGNDGVRNHLSTDVRAEIESSEQEKQNLRQHLTDLQAQKDTLSQRKQALMQEIQTIDSRDARLQEGIRGNKKKIDDITAKLEEVEPVDVSVFTSSIEAAQAKRETEVAQMEGLQKERDMLMAAYEEKKALRNGVKTRKDELFGGLKKYDVAITSATTVRSAKQAEKVKWVTKLRNDTELLKKAQSEYDQLELDYNAFVEKAAAYCDKVEVDHEAGYYSRKIEALKRSLANQQQNLNVDLDEVITKLNAAVKKVKEQKDTIEGLRSMQERVKESLAQRRTSWQQMRNALTTKTANGFMKNLNQRGFSGKLKFSHELQSLRLEVITETEQTQANKNTNMHKGARALSGGETSFSTICLLLALWDSVLSPIKCLDEFDVFMDAHNRALSIGMLVDYAKRQSREVQYILITPQDMSNVQLGPSIQVHKMPDPKRAGADQTRLDFRPAEE